MNDDRELPPPPGQDCAPILLEPRLAERAAKTSEEASPDYNAVFDRVFAEAIRHQQALEAEKSQAAALVAELRFQPSSRRRLLLHNSRRYRTWAVCQGLIDASYQVGFHEPRESVDFATLATELVDQLDRDRYGLAPLTDLAAAAWSQHANALRISGDFPAAEASFRTAEVLLAEGSGDPLALARFQDLKASLLRTLGRFDDSLRLLTAALQSYRRMGEFRLVGRALIKVGMIHSLNGGNPEAIEATRAGLELLDATADRQQVVTGRHNLARFLTDAGRFFEARALVSQLRRAYVEGGEEIPMLRLRVLEGHIALGLGNATEAESAYLQARDGLLTAGLGYEAAAVSLDLAVLFMRQQRTAEVKQLAMEMVPIFRSHEVHREALAALLLFRHAVVSETASLEFTERVRSYLRSAQKNPQLRFDAASLGRSAPPVDG